MAKFLTENVTINKSNKAIEIIKKSNFDSFNENILGLGQINEESIQTNALSVMFDLEGFTNFCKQIDPQLALPEFLSEFLKWIFNELKLELTIKKYVEGYETWANLPFFSKFLGDGVLFLWDTQNMNNTEIRNIVATMYEICQSYKSKFLPKISNSIVAPPPKLRCGIARGAIYSIGDGNDFVGPCINMSARLQKLHTFSFCFSRRGINPNEMGSAYNKLFITRKFDIRGIGSDELVCTLQSEFEDLTKEDQKKFST